MRFGRHLMLQLQNICKSYTTGSFTQKALDNVSISFRDNEFVAILGPSGSGKTTMLNIIGGLDHYDSGNMIIDGVSTEQYKDRDWDTYRNNRIGFVFQSYNLIPHQTVLANVELALTLSGVSPAERKQRALEALAKVGLADHVNKKPSQMSGGQMQRVAIARALINDPEILLADEPTGALDSKTSVQIMDLLTEIARDRLVVMVTHNPELAEEYATRIVTLTDGVVRNDTDPYLPTPEEMHASQKQVRRTSMSFFTALSLSFNNLMTKKGRTIMTAFAGSIGIIGIAAILALANGVNDYIKTIEEETLSEYPLQITSSGLDMSAMLTGGESMADEEDAEAAAEDEVEMGLTVQVGGNTVVGEDPAEGAAEAEAADEVRVFPMVSFMFSSVGQNDLASLKTFLDNEESLDPYVKAIEYSYGVQPQVFSADTENLRQVNPDTSLSALGISSSNSNNSIMSMTMSTDVFYQMPSDPSLYETQYDVLAGHWPESYNECVLVTTASGSMSDFMLYTLGLRDTDELDTMVEQFANEEEVTAPEGIRDYAYDEIVGITFKLVSPTDFYAYDAEYDVWVDKRENKAYMRELVAGGEDLTIVGIVKPAQDATAAMLASGINYPASLTEHVIELSATSQIVRDQLADPDINVFTGKPFGEEDEDGVGMDNMFTVDTAAIESAFQFDTSALALDFEGVDFSIDLSKLPAFPTFDDMPMPDLEGVIPNSGGQPGAGDVPNSGSGSTTTPDAGGNEGEPAVPGEGDSSTQPDAGDEGSASDDAEDGAAEGGAGTPGEGDSAPDPEPETPDEGNPAPEPETPATPELPESATLIQQLIFNIAQDLSEDYVANHANQPFADYLRSDAARAIIEKHLGPISDEIAETYTEYFEQKLTGYMNELMASLQKQIEGAMMQVMGQLMANMGNAFSFDASAFENAFQFNMTEEEFGELMMAMMYSTADTYDNNLKDLGYAKLTRPTSISIYPYDFASKEIVVQTLDDYNARMEEAGEDDKVINYTDLVGTLMSSVTDIVDTISYVLIAFVAISLVVSSIMIGVITYISVLERKKEIGILRAIGASKGDISRVFNAETVIEGLVAGLLGVSITALACIPANAIVYEHFDVPNVAQLPIEAAAILVGISVFLTFIAGLIPSSAASRKDPVEALRSE